MPIAGPIKASQKPVKAYYEALASFVNQKVKNESTVRKAFQDLLSETGRKRGWTLLPELDSRGLGNTRIAPDGTLKDEFLIPRGYWEAKDIGDDLDTEIEKKKAKGYPLTNIIFQNSNLGVLYQDGNEAFRADLTKPTQLVDLLNLFLTHSEPNIDHFEKAVDEFKERVPELAQGLTTKIAQAHENNPRFIEAFRRFFDLCKASLNPNLSIAAVDEMLVQHLLTERLFRTVFSDSDFTNRNVIAVEVEKVIAALVSKSFNRGVFLKSLDRFYVAIESAAQGLENFTDKQHFLNTVYERFFQGFSVKVADTHGIVYTPQPIVDFICASVSEVLDKEFGKTLGSPGVNILDPCTGTGNFIVNLLHRIPKRDLPRVYKEQLFANEVMLLPYYIAALNIEHAYYERTGEYEPFEGLCFVDSLDMAEHAQSEFGFMTEKNTARVERQRGAPITVIVGNPPYNVGQLNENDNNKNRKYKVVDKHIRETYVEDSKATLKTQLYDAYVRFFRWATDRLDGREGIVSFISNNGFLEGLSFDGFRKHISQDFDTVYHFDFKGNARTTGERRRQEGGNIFHDQIRCGVGISILVRRKTNESKRIHYHVVGDYWGAEEKEKYLLSFPSASSVPWVTLMPDKKHSWLVSEEGEDFGSYTPLGSKSAKSRSAIEPKVVFKLYSGGIKSNRDHVVYDFNRYSLEARVAKFIEDYNSEVDRYKRLPSAPANVDEFVDVTAINWDGTLKGHLAKLKYATFDLAKIRPSLYRPFTRRFLYFERLLINSVYLQFRFFPTQEAEEENKVISITNHTQTPFSLIVLDCIPEHAIGGRAGQCFPFYVYDENGKNRRENISLWALRQFRERYEAKGKKIDRWDIFYYVYGLLHHPGYREKYGDCLKRELPRIPFAPDFWAFADTGRELAKWHLEYEKIEPYDLRDEYTEGKPLSFRVEDKMRLSKDKSAIKVNPSLTLTGIPPETFEYKLGNRSALDWVIDQYRVKKDDRSRIVSDPNCAGSP